MLSAASLPLLALVTRPILRPVQIEPPVLPVVLVRRSIRSETHAVRLCALEPDAPSPPATPPAPPVDAVLPEHEIEADVQHDSHPLAASASGDVDTSSQTPPTSEDPNPASSSSAAPLPLPTGNHSQHKVVDTGDAVYKTALAEKSTVRLAADQPCSVYGCVRMLCSSIPQGTRRLMLALFLAGVTSGFGSVIVDPGACQKLSLTSALAGAFTWGNNLLMLAVAFVKLIVARGLMAVTRPLG